MARNALLRIGNIVRAEVEDVLGRIENPRKLVNQMLLDMEKAFEQAVGEVSRAIANEKIIERRLRNAVREVERLQKDAETAVEQGDDDGARRALDSKVAVETTAAELKRSHDEATEAAGKLKAQLGELRTKLESARNRRETVASRRHCIRESGELGSRLNRRPFDEFDRLVNQVDRDEIASEVYQEMAGMQTEDRDLEKLERDRKVKTELEQLKRSTNKEQG